MRGRARRLTEERAARVVFADFNQIGRFHKRNVVRRTTGKYNYSSEGNDDLWIHGSNRADWAYSFGRRRVKYRPKPSNAPFDRLFKDYVGDIEPRLRARFGGVLNFYRQTRACSRDSTGVRQSG